ncbi:MAG: HNH endonuclease [Magnetococcales bacterium]|nr:HNH endonuclease [Magnetococcales bacterium]
MAKSRNIAIKDIKIIYGAAAALCSMPDCREELLLSGTKSEKVQQIGELAHIIGKSDDAARGDPDYPLDQRDHHKNLILLCPSCHSKIDKQPNIWPVKLLEKIKKEHEEWVRIQLNEAFTRFGFDELEEVTKRIQAKPGQEIFPDVSLLNIPDKMARNNLTEEIKGSIQIGLLKSDLVRSYLQSVAKWDDEFPERLKSGFVKEYNRVRSKGLVGNDLFQAMQEFASDESWDFTQKAAGLSVLVYLFQSCEVFEK